MATEKRQRAIAKRKKSMLKKAEKAAEASKMIESTLVRVQALGDVTSDDGDTLSMEDLTEILAPYTEQITIGLYQELLEKGFPKKDLDELRFSGMQYNRARNSIMDPYSDPLILIEYRQNEKTGKFQLFESKLKFHQT